MKILLLLVFLLGGCASIGPVATGIGAAASVGTFYYTIKDRQDVIVYSRECLWYRPVKLSEEGKAGLLRSDKEQIAFNNLTYQESCPEVP